MKQLLLRSTIVTCLITGVIDAQVGIQTTSPQATLDVRAKNAAAPTAEDGLLIPRISNFPATNPTAGQEAMLVYLTNDLIGVNISGTAKDYDRGFYRWDNALTDWINIAGSAGWKLDGNADAVSGTHFIGTTNAQELDFRVNNKFVGRITELGQLELESDVRSLYIGFEAGEDFVPGATNNVFLGYRSGTSTTIGSNNSTVGSLTFRENTTGSDNTALGYRTLERSDTGDGNTAVGSEVMFLSRGVSYNTGIGYSALINNISGNRNVALGAESADNVRTGNDNVFIGYASLTNKSDISRAVAIGHRVEASENEAIVIGSQTIGTGARGIAMGTRATTTFNDAIAIGTDTQAIEEEAIAIGNLATASSAYTLAIGFDANATRDNSIAIGRGARATAANRIRFGNTNINSIQGRVNFSTFSDKRFKENIQRDIVGLDFIKALEPVSYTFNQAKLSAFMQETTTDTAQAGPARREIGFLAQDVEAAAKKTGFNFSGVQPPEHEGDLYTLQYSSFVVPLTKAVQEQQEIIERQEDVMQEQKDKIDTLEQRLAQIEAWMRSRE